MTDSDGDFQLIESLLFNGSYQRLERHMARLGASAGELGFVFTEARVRTKLSELAAGLGHGDYKVRLLLNRDGSVELTAAPISVSTTPTAIMVAAEPVDSSWPLAGHKTTRRDRFTAHLAAAAGRGAQDVLFLNERGELAECANSNVFLELDGHLLTPPLDAGVLPGVYRQDVLSSNPRAREARLTESDLAEAEAIFVCNSVRGWRQAELISGLLRLGGGVCGD